MSLVALDGTPLVAIGSNAGFQGAIALPTATNITQDAANEATIMIGQVFTEDGASHTIDTTGSSKLGWMCASSTFANAGSTFKVGIAAVDTATGPPGRAVNVADVITFDVVASFTGGGAGVTSGAWNESVPTSGTKTIANGDLVAFCTQMTARAGVDSILTQVAGTSSLPRPFVTSFTGAAYAAASAVPNAVITFSDGARGYFAAGSAVSTPSTTQSWNNTSGTKEYGNYFLMPVPTKIYGLIGACNFAGDCDLILYSDPLGTPVAEKTVSVDLNVVGTAASARWSSVLFSSPHTTTARQPVAGIFKPTSATNVQAPYKSVNTAAYMNHDALGTNCYAINRNTGAFAAQNSNKDRFAMALLVGAFEHGVWPMGYLGV
jgi:hypothetical protein